MRVLLAILEHLVLRFLLLLQVFLHLFLLLLLSFRRGFTLSVGGILRACFRRNGAGQAADGEAKKCD